MNTMSRYVGVSAIGLLVAALASCAGGVDSDPELVPNTENKQEDGLANVDLCSLVKPQALTAAGLDGPGNSGSLASQPTCEFEGKNILMALYANPKKPVELSADEDDWARFDPIDVNGRSAAEAVAAGSTRAGICSVLFDSGGGSIQVQVTAVDVNKIDECAEAGKVARLIEPNTPK